MPQAIYHGHSCVELHGGGKKLIVDPFLTHNPKADVTADQISVDYILVTHGHDDHVGDTVAMAKRCDATVICNFDLGMIFYKEGLKVHMMHIGGAHDFAFGRVKLTIAHHGAGYGMETLQYAGPPTGMLVTLDGKTVYHAGDTGLFYDMKLIGERHPIDLAFLPIGDNFTMGIEDAAVAVEFLKPKQVVPIHYATEEMIDVDPEKFRSLVKGAKTVIMKPGETLEF